MWRDGDVSPLDVRERRGPGDAGAHLAAGRRSETRRGRSGSCTVARKWERTQRCREGTQTAGSAQPGPRASEERAFGATHVTQGKPPSATGGPRTTH